MLENLHLNDTEAVASSIAQDLTREWLHKSEKNAATVKNALVRMQLAVKGRSSPRKGMNSCLDILGSIESPRNVMIFREEKHARLFNFRITFLGGEDDSVHVSHLMGMVNWRTKNVSLGELSTARLSFHSIVRLVSRLKDPDGELLLAEIGSGMRGAESWLNAGRKVKASCWPLVTNNGIFVAADGFQRTRTTLITWLSEIGISAKWRAPLESLRTLNAVRPDLALTEEFKVAFISAHPFMLHEHEKEEDVEKNLAIQDIFYRPHQNENDSDLDTLEQSLSSDPGSMHGRSIKAYLIGVNYGNVPHGLSRHDRYKGTLITKDPAGMYVVGLPNGLTGKIPGSSFGRGLALIPNYSAPRLGDSIDLIVSNVKRHDDIGAYVVILEPVEVYDAMWAQAKATYTIGSPLRGTLLRSAVDGFFVHVDRYIKGRLRGLEDVSYPIYCALAQALLGRHVLSFQVCEYDDKNYLLVLGEVCGLDGLVDPQGESTLNGEGLSARCIRTEDSYSLVSLAGGSTGMLHHSNCWGSPLPQPGEMVHARVYEFDVSNSRVSLELFPPSSIATVFLRRSDRDFKVIEFYEAHKAGDVVKVQVRGFNVHDNTVSVCSELGTFGSVPWREFCWEAISVEQVIENIVYGEICPALITRIRPEKRLFILSLKALLPDPTESLLCNIKIGALYEGTVIKPMDYGYFVRLEINGLQALMHKSEVPESAGRFQKGDRLRAQVKTVDVEAKRISLTFSSLILASDC